MEAIKTLLAQSRVSIESFKLFGVTSKTKTLKSKVYLLGLCKQFAGLDYPANASDAEILRIYGIAGDDLENDVDPRVALAILLDKENIEARKRANILLRREWFSGANIQQSENPIISREKPEKDRETKVESEKRENEIPNGIPLGILETGKHDSTFSRDAMDDVNFPKGSKITRPFKLVKDCITSMIKSDYSDLKSKRMIRVNGFATATGLKVNVSQWIDNNSSKAYVSAVMRSTKKSMDQVYTTANGAGTWVHVLVAVEIARWMDPDFSVMVNDLVLRFISGDLTLIGDVLDTHDEIEGTKTNALSTAPGNGSQIRQNTFESAVVDTMSAEQLEMQLKINASQAAFNHKLMRAIDYSKPVTRGELMVRDRDTGALVINKAAVNKTNVERALITLYPEMFYGDNITTMHDLIEEMWFKIVNLENSIAIASGPEVKQSESDSSLVIEQKMIIKQLRVHIENLTTIHRLKPLIDQLNRPKTRRPVNHYSDPGFGNNDSDEPNVGVIYDLLNEVFSGARIRQNVVDALNWQMTSKLGCEFKTHVDFRNLTAVVSDMTDILRADLTTREFNPVITRDYGNLWNARDQSLQSEWSPVYYHSVLADVSLPGDPSDHQSSFDDAYSESETVASDASSCASTCASNPSDPYSAVSIHVVKPKRSSAPSRARVTKRAHDLGDELRLAILKVLEDRANTTQPVVMKSRDEQVLNMYIGQEGYAFNLIPMVTGAVPRIIIAVSLGDILEAGAFHLRPCGQITLTPGMTSHKAMVKLASAKLPGGTTIGPAIFAITRDYAASGKSPVTAMIRIVVSAIGHESVTTITCANDPAGQSWNIVTPREL